MSSISLHPEYGVNPSLEACFLCGEDTGSILLLGANKGKEAPRHSVTGNLCNKCESTIADGNVFIIECLLPAGKNPVRTGRMVAINKEALNIDAPKGIALMLKEEFEQAFGGGFEQ